ncbi:PH domain-containing protein [Chryseobacterium sp. BIGb0232]|uniref:PH domain-containing protein n=1 Tax=Chryseobacterium sp. BIGb0232 TaxID=2940598 RepID=UPI00160EDF18|nr:PH domain-containing protein [Chryseobacterium sp. BIGb0232]MCS4304726.1 hypothetical protein [Chryseobacterium sp. BIGb0232]
MNKIYREFSLYSNEFSLYQVRTLLKKESQFEEFKTVLFRINPSLSDYSDIALRKIFRMVNDERFIHGIFGKHDQRGYGTLISTDKRLIFIDAGNDFSFVFKEIISLKNITSIDFSSSNNLITISTSEKNIIVGSENQGYGADFCEAVQQLLGNSDETKPQEQSASGILDMIERFGKLKENGILTHEEFTDQKKKLLDKL